MSQFKYNFDKSVNGVLGIRTWGRNMEGADKSTELRRHPRCFHFKYMCSSIKRLLSVVISVTTLSYLNFFDNIFSSKNKTHTKMAPIRVLWYTLCLSVADDWATFDRAKVSQIFRNHWGYFKMSLLCKNCTGYLWATLWKNGQIFISISTLIVT